MRPDSLSRPAPIHAAYFKGAIAVVLTLGASWGTLLLWKIGIAGSFHGISVFEVNAHGHAQIFGWVGLFVMGAAWRLLPAVWGTEPARLRPAMLALAAMLVGIVLRSTGMTIAGAPAALPLTLVGGGLELLAIGLFVGAMLGAFRRSGARLTPANAFLLSGVALLALQAVASLWHSWNTMTAVGDQALIWAVATWQAPLRDLQVHGLALFMITGVALTVFPTLWGLPPASARRGWWAYGLLSAGLIGEIAIFLTYRFTGQHWVAALLMLPWLALAVGVGLLVRWWRPWRALPVDHAGARYIRVAAFWLVLSVAMLLLMPVYQAVSGIAFSHAYYGAIRHAITVGFVSVTMMGMAMRLRDEWAGNRAAWPALPFLLINLGCALRVSLQIATDFVDPAFLWVGLSGMLEVTALAWWGIALWRRLPALGEAARIAPQFTAERAEAAVG